MAIGERTSCADQLRQKQRAIAELMQVAHSGIVWLYNDDDDPSITTWSDGFQSMPVMIDELVKSLRVPPAKVEENDSNG